MEPDYILAEFFDAYDELTPERIIASLILRNKKVSSFGNLKYVEYVLDVSGSHIKTLGNIEYVGSSLNLCNTEIKSLGKLKHVGGSILCSRGEQYDKIKAENNGRFYFYIQTR